uniref:LiaF transmembrane domain-containing protein n=1 Tax=Oleiagrimonas sp. TaxID=2010330 RepID=UPI00261566E1
AQGLAVGVVVIAIGLYLLLDNLGVHMPFLRYHNWWAAFILIGAIGPIMQAMGRYRASGRFDGMVARHALTALVIVSVALMFLLDLSWNIWWPIFIIYGGCWMLLKPPPSYEDE